MANTDWRLQRSGVRHAGIRAGLGAVAWLGMLMSPTAVWAQDSTSATPGQAQAGEMEPIITDRPDFTESTETVPAGMTQIEGGYTYARVGGERSHSFGEVLVRHALGRKTELRFEVPSLSRTRGVAGRESGFEDGSIGFKTMLSQGAGGFGLKSPRISLIGDTNLPIGSRRFRQTALQPGVKLLFGVDLAERLSLSSNLNYAYLSEEGERFGEFSASLSLGIGVAERVGSYVEVFGFFPGGNRDKSRFINGGFTYLVNNDFQLDARLGFGLGNDAGGPDAFFGVGVARRF